jgi:hypothetical protein
MDEHFLEATQESCHLNCSLLMGMSPPPYQWMVRLEQVHSRDWTWQRKSTEDVAVPLSITMSFDGREVMGDDREMIKVKGTQE